MDFNPPTAADYAYNDANEALRKNRDLEARVAALERQIQDLRAMVDSLVNALQTRR